MTNWWIVTSALATSGAFTQVEKFHQTVLTLTSILKKSSNNKIIFLEGSNHEIVGAHRRTIASIVDQYCEYWHQTEFQNLFLSPNRERQNLKSSMETYLLHNMCHYYLTNLVQPSDRVFKLSGRYKLNDQFSLHTHEMQKNKWCFAPASYGASIGYDRPGQLSTRLYSFCGSQIADAARIFKEVYDTILQEHERGSWTDIEHTMFNLIPPEKRVHANVIGVEGNFSKCGGWIQE